MAVKKTPNNTKSASVIALEKDKNYKRIRVPKLMKFKTPYEKLIFNEVLAIRSKDDWTTADLRMVKRYSWLMTQIKDLEEQIETSDMIGKGQNSPITIMQNFNAQLVQVATKLGLFVTMDKRTLASNAKLEKDSQDLNKVVDKHARLLA